MAIIKPFKAVRPANEYVKMVAELPYDVMNREEAKKLAKGNKYSYLHIDRAEIDLDDNVNEHDEKVYLKAKENLNKFIDKNIFIKDEEEAIYIYREIVNDRAQTGIVACVAIDDNLNGVVKKHEYTKPDKELDRTNHIKYCNANTGTVLLTYKNKEEIEKRYSELRASGIFSVNNIVSLLHKWIVAVGYNNYVKEFKVFNETPSYRNSNLSDSWKLDGFSPVSGEKYDNNKTYAINESCNFNGYVFVSLMEQQGVPPVSKIYDKNPTVLGFYNSEKRVYNWLVKRFTYLDKLFNYKY